jgi:hypothetical protein
MRDRLLKAIIMTTDDADDLLENIRKQTEAYFGLLGQRKSRFSSKESETDSSSWLDSEYLDKLPWKPQRNGRVFWIFFDECPTLAAKLEANDGSMVIDGWVYEFRCNGKFIVRYRLRQDRRV